MGDAPRPLRATGRSGLMTTLAPLAPSASPENLYSKSTDATERSRIKAEVVSSYLPRVTGMSRAILSTPQHWGDLEQAGVVGLLAALEAYEPGQGAFWTFAWRHVRDEMRSWIETGVYSRRQGNRGASEQRRANRARIATISIHVTYEDDHADQSPTPEELVEAKELLDRLEGFVSRLDVSEQATFLVDDARQYRGRHHKSLMERAREHFSKPTKEGPR